MNTPDVFKRVEYKYLLSSQQFDSLTESLADAALQDGCLLPRRIQIAEEISQCCKRWEMPRPAMMVCVEREAYRCISAPDLRITFDIMLR